MKKAATLYIILLSSLLAQTSFGTNLEKTLRSENIWNEIRSQAGVYKPTLYDQNNNGALFSFKTKRDSKIDFKGIGALESSFNPRFLDTKDEDLSPAFMFTFKKRGNSIEIGGDVKGLNLKNWNEYIMPREGK